MADDEDYWNSTSTAKPFDFDDIGDAGGGDSVLRLFGVASKTHLPKQQDESSLGVPDDVRSNASDESSRSLRSDLANDELFPSPSVGKSVVSRTSSVLSASTRSVGETTISSQNSSPSSSNTSAGKSIKQALAKTLQPNLTSSSAGALTTDASFRPRLDSSSSSHSQLTAEVQHLRRNLEVSRKDQWIKILPKEMVWRIIRNKAYSLENYRSMEQKVALLDYALNLHETNAILITLLHMKYTLNPSLFISEISKKPDAVDQYVSYLKDDGRYQECLDFLEALGRLDEVATLQLAISQQSNNIQTQLKDLDVAMKRQPPSSPTRPSDLLHLKKFKSLLEIQRPIEEHDEKAARDPKNDIFIQHPRTSVLGLSLIQTLFYCCMYHFDKAETSFCSPHFLRKTFAITEKQFLWTALDALSKTQKWTEIQMLLTDRTGWLGKAKPKAVIGFDKVVDTLARNETPADVMAYYLRLIDDPEVRLQYSLKCKCHSVAIDTLAALKEFDKLQDYSAKFDSASNEYKYCQEILHKVSVK